MAASVSGSKTCTVAPAPHLSASTLTTLMAIAPENMTLAQFFQIADALNRVAKASEHSSSSTVGSFLS